MIDLNRAVYAALKDVCTQVVYGYPADFTGNELLCWRESENRRHAQADGREYLAEVNYTLEIFAPEAEAAYALLQAADARMQMLGFRRESIARQFERDPRVHHITARYRALADAAGNIYQ